MSTNFAWVLEEVNSDNETTIKLFSTEIKSDIYQTEKIQGFMNKAFLRYKEMKCVEKVQIRFEPNKYKDKSKGILWIGRGTTVKFEFAQQFKLWWEGLTEESIMNEDFTPIYKVLNNDINFYLTKQEIL